MGIQPSEAKKLTLWEYQALMFGWNKAHSPEDTIEPPTIEETQRRMKALEARGIKVLH